MPTPITASTLSALLSAALAQTPTRPLVLALDGRCGSGIEKFGDWDNGHLPFPRLRSLCRGWRSIPYWIVRCTAKLRLA